jgi:prepilin-type N-terminal cleavage/methylation domain-containing protein
VRRERAGLTLIEVLVACAVMALLGASAAGLLTGGLRLQAQAARRTARTEALAPWTVPGARPATRLPACDAVDAAADGPAACVVALRRCRLDAAAVACDGAGALWRLDLDVVGADGAPLVPGAAPLRAWTEAP